MNSLCSSVLSCSHLFFGGVSSNIDTQSQTASEVAVFQTPTMDVIVPEQPLAPGAVRIIPRKTSHHYADWTQDNQRESYYLSKKSFKSGTTRELTTI